MTTPEARPRLDSQLSPRPLWVIRLARVVRSLRARAQIRAADQMPAPLDVTGVPGPDHRTPSSPPVFVVAAGWRSGSTALQRLIISGGDAFIWGEPFPTSRLLPRLHSIVVEAAVIDGQPDRVLEPEEISPDLWSSWLATTNPDTPTLLAGVRAMLQEVYWGPLRHTDFSTWGTKEVVATPDQLDLLRAVFPDARFVGIVRNPADAYRSFRRFVVSGVSTRPGPANRLAWVKGPIGYARTWSRMARKLRELAGEPNVLVVRYEDVSGDPRFPTRLGEFLGMDLRDQAWSTRVGSLAAYLQDRPGVVERAELAVLRAIIRREARRWHLHGRQVQG